MMPIRTLRGHQTAGPSAAFLRPWRRAREEAFALIERDPDLSAHRELKAELERGFADSIDWLFHS